MSCVHFTGVPVVKYVTFGLSLDNQLVMSINPVNYFMHVGEDDCGFSEAWLEKLTIWREIQKSGFHRYTRTPSLLPLSYRVLHNY